MASIRWQSMAALGLLIPLSASTVLADRIAVRSGSVIKGKAIIDDAHPDQYLVIGEKGKTPIILKKSRVLSIEAEPSVLDEYVVRRKAIGQSKSKSPQEEYDLAVWCLEHKLTDLSVVHLEATIKRDPNFGPAHQRLGHVFHDDKWLTPSELKAAQGFIYFKGKWISPEEKAERDAEASVTAEQQSWMRRLAILKQAMINGPEERSRTAESQLLGIREPAAARPVARTFGNDGDPAMRKLAARVLAVIPGPESSALLVVRFLDEAEPGVREATMTELARLPQAVVVPRLVQSLRSESIAVVNRAAWALGQLKAVASVPRLVSALISTEVRVVLVPSAGSGINAGFSSINSNGGGGSGYGMGGGQSIPILTGPVVGPGVVAFGATSVPASAFSGTTFGIGGGASRGPEPKLVTVTHENTEVRSALIALTGQDFGYDVSSWQYWLRTAYQPDRVPVKRVPQP